MAIAAGYSVTNLYVEINGKASGFLSSFTPPTYEVEEIKQALGPGGETKVMKGQPKIGEAAATFSIAQEGPLFDWVAKQGIDRAKFEAAYKSFSVNAQLGRAKTLTQNYQVGGVPTFVINGKYATSPGSAHGEKRMFAIVDKLVAEERAKK